MKKIIAIILALITALSLTACFGGVHPSEEAPAPDSTAPDSTAVDNIPAPVKPADGLEYAGSWMDFASQRAGMVITQADDSSYEVNVHWGSSAWEAVEWVMHAAYDPESGKLVYSDGSERIVTYSDESSDPTIQVLYEGSVGAFTLLGDRVTWTDDKDPDASDGRIFIKADTENVPDDLRFIGFFVMDDSSQLDITYKPDGTFGVDMSIYRLASFDGGKGVYDSLNDALLVTAEDPNGNPIEFTLTKAEDYGVKVDVSNSTWDLLPTGESFLFQ